VLLPVGEQAQFRLQKEKMLLRVEGLDGNQRELRRAVDDAVFRQQHRRGFDLTPESPSVISLKGADLNPRPSSQRIRCLLDVAFRQGFSPNPLTWERIHSRTSAPYFRSPRSRLGERVLAE
jgi:hypothetical protein